MLNLLSKLLMVVRILWGFLEESRSTGKESSSENLSQESLDREREREVSDFAAGQTADDFDDGRHEGAMGHKS